MQMVMAILKMWRLGTNYIYDSAAKKWYYSPQGTNLGGISNSVDKGGKTEAQIIDKIKNEGQRSHPDRQHFQQIT